MRRAALLIVVALGLLLATPCQQVEAFHGHHGGWGGGHHGGWGHWGGGWGGGYRHWGGWGGGWGGYGGWGYRPFYSFYRPYYGIGLGVGWGGYGYGWGGYYGGYYPSYYSSYYFSNPYYYSSPYFYGQSPYYYNSYYYGYPTCSYTTPSINYYAATPVVNVTRIVINKAAPAPAVAPPARTVAPPAPAIAAPRATTLVRSSITDRSRARQHMKLGDSAFLAGRYADALLRYRNAGETAPDYAEAFYRKGHAYVAVGKYDLAAAAFRRALELEPAARRDGFRLDDLYGAGSRAKVVHLDNLAASALMREDDADNYFLLGLMLRFDGEHERAEKFLAKAASLSPAMRTALAAFLPDDDKERTVSLEVGDEI